MLVLSLFPGIGLLDRAFEEVGFCVVRGPDVLWGGDIHRFRPPAGRFDGVIGGPPCQAFSVLRHLVEQNGCQVAENLNANLKTYQQTRDG
jgi:DNA (cytosine-5)-methyltransferase 1